MPPDATGQAALEARGLVKAFGRGEPSSLVLDSISLRIAPGELVSLVGPNGAGKTTLLRVIAGLDTADAGEVRAGTGHVALVFQDYADSLLPWRSNLDNVALPFEVRGLGRTARRERVRQWLSEWRPPGDGASGDLFEKLGIPPAGFPYTLSGGQRQWLAIARALVVEPAVLLLDEPFAALDVLGRGRAEERLTALHERRAQATLLVSHALDEAVAMADRVLVCSPRPMRIVESVEVDLPRPRPPLSVLSRSPRFFECLQAVQAAFFGAAA